MQNDTSSHSRRRDIFCPHCECLVPKTTYYRHKEQFYNPFERVWSNVKKCESSASSLSTTHPGSVDGNDIEEFMNTIDTDHDSADETAIVGKEFEMEENSTSIT